MNIKVSYKVKWQLKFNNSYVWTSCKKLINMKTGKEIKRTLKGLTAGYWISKKFIKLADLRNEVELIKEVKCPF